MIPLVAAALSKSKQNDDPVQEEDDLTDKLLDGLLAGGIGLGTFLFIRKVVNNAKRKSRQKNALVPGNPASDAIQLRMAFENDNWFGWGTDEELIFNVLESIPDSTFMRKVQKAYRDLYKTELVADMQNDMDTVEFAKALSIINSKP